MDKKIWSIKDRNEKLSDQELINLLKDNKISIDTYIKSDDMKDYIKIDDSVYRFYLEVE